MLQIYIKRAKKWYFKADGYRLTGYRLQAEHAKALFSNTTIFYPMRKRLHD